MTKINERRITNLVNFRNNMPPLSIELYEELVRDYTKHLKV